MLLIDSRFFPKKSEMGSRCFPLYYSMLTVLLGHSPIFYFLYPPYAMTSKSATVTLCDSKQGLGRRGYSTFRRL